MEASVEVQPQVTLQDVTAFLSKQNEDKDRLASLEERTSYAITLLQSLPCARYAVLEKIGEVFFDEAQQYIVEVERQHLAGLPSLSEQVETNRDVQIKKIQQVLVSSIESNSKAWAPVIFQWAVQTLSQICGQYGTKRHFGSMTLEERLQMWLTCSATNSLMEITVSCLKKIIQKNQDNCLKILLNATLTYTPYFNWALAHICCAFPEIVPYKFLCHTLDVFSKQSRKAEVVKETMLTIFTLIMPQKEEYIKDALLKLFMSSLIKVSDKPKTEQHITLCIIPFLLHLATNVIDVFVPIIDKILGVLSLEHFHILHDQSKLREVVLQRGMVRRTVNCLKMINGRSYKILQYLIKYSCMENEKLCEDDPDLAKSVQTICFVVLESLQLQLKHEVHVYAHYAKESIKIKGDEPVKVPFLTSLALYTKQCCKQMLTSTGTKKEILQDFIVLMALQEGRNKMIEILSFILVNSTIDTNKGILELCVTEFELQEPNIFEESIQIIFRNIHSSDYYTKGQINNLVSNLLKLIGQEDEGETVNSEVCKISSHVKWHVSTIAQVCMTSDDDILCMETLHLLKGLCTKDLRMSEYAILVQSVLQHYFKCINKLTKMDDKNELEGICGSLRFCDELLVITTSQYKGMQQFVLRLLIQGILRPDEEEFTTEPEEPSPKVELMGKNNAMVLENRFHSSITSMVFKTGLRLNKRKLEVSNAQNMRYVRQYFNNTLFSVLSLNGGFESSTDDYEMKEKNFFSVWGEAQFARPFPSAYAYTANLLVELVCPETVPVMVWPDEDFLKYTIERDLKVKNTFDEQSLLWDILEMISTARPSLFHCSVLVQSLFGMSLKFWESNRCTATTDSKRELQTTTRLLYILKQAGWLPTEFESISDVFPLIKPKEVYEILSAIWRYFKISSFSPDRFIDRDQLGRPQLTTIPDNLQNIRSVIKIILFRNIAKTGHLYKRFLSDHPI